MPREPHLTKDEPPVAAGERIDTTDIPSSPLLAALSRFGRIPDTEDATHRLRVQTLNLLSLTTFITQFFFAGLNLLRDPEGWLSLGNLGLAVLLLVNAVLYRNTGWIRVHSIPPIVVMLAYLIWSSYRVDVGVLVWVIGIPVPTFILLGVRDGLIWNAVFGIVITIALAFHGLPFPGRFEAVDIPLAFVATTLLSLIGEMARARFADRMIQLSSYDSLTGLLNRRVFEERGSAELERARRYKHPVVLLMMDADHFKAVNDVRGHTAGDRALIVLAFVIKSTLRAIDSVGRWGGEEIAAILPETGLGEAMQAAERVRVAVDQNEELKEFGVTLSIGLAQARPDESFGDVVRRADAALYGAKRAGRNRVVKDPDL